MNEAFHLSRLQTIDSQLDQTSARLAEIARLLADDQTVKAAEQHSAALAQVFDAARKALHTAEAAVEAQRTKIELAENSLYGGKVRNPKELQDIQNELASLKRHLAVIEDQQLEAMLNFDQTESDAKAAETALAAVRADFASRSAVTVGEQSRLLRENERLQAERQAIIAQVDPAAVELYERLRRQKGGRAVAGITDESCTACGASITQRLWQEARSPNKITYCPTCGRLLYGG